MIIKSILVVLIFIFVHQALTQTELLKKFHQNDYKVKNVRMDTEFVNYSYVKIFKLISFKYNRTVTAINTTAITKIDLDDKINVVVQAYKFASNEYRLFPLRFEYNICKGFKMNIIGLQKLKELANIDLCKIKKNTMYQVYNFVIDYSQLPPLIPTGEYKIVNTLIHGQDEGIAGIVNLYGEVHRPFVK